MNALLQNNIIKNEDELISLTESHFRHIAGSLTYQDFKNKYFSGNTPLHIIFSLDEEVPSLAAINKLQELFLDKKISRDNLRNIFEAENDAGLTPIELLLNNSVQTIVAISSVIKSLEFLEIYLHANTKNGTICKIAGKKFYNEVGQAIFYKEIEKIATPAAERESLQ